MGRVPLDLGLGQAEGQMQDIGWAGFISSWSCSFCLWLDRGQWTGCGVFGWV
jgi:hypothetical protein